MKVEIFIIGKNDSRYIDEQLSMFHTRISPLIPFEIKHIQELKLDKGKPILDILKKQSELVLKSISPGDTIVLLDEKGKEYTSEEFANYIQMKSNIGTKKLIFIIGGAYGFGTLLYSRANELLSLSKMTFTHQMVRIIFVEQLYRALTINHHMPYHHGNNQSKEC